MVKAALFGIAFSGLMVLSGCSWQSARFTETRQLMVNHVPGSGVDIQATNGSISVKVAHVERVEIDARLKATSQERLDDTKIQASRQDDGTLVLRVVGANGKRQGSEGCSFDVRVPGVSDARLESSNGSLTLQGATGRANLVTSNGAIGVSDHHGGVKAETSNGKVSVTLGDDSDGPVEIDTSNGGVSFEVARAFRGTVTARTSNGMISVKGFSDEEIVSKSRTRCEVRSEGVERETAGASPLGESAKSSIHTSNGGVSIRRRGE